MNRSRAQASVMEDDFGNKWEAMICEGCTPCEHGICCGYCAGCYFDAQEVYIEEHGHDIPLQVNGDVWISDPSWVPEYV